MSGFEIFGVNPPLYLVRGAKDIGRKSGDSVSVEPFAVAIAAARAGYNGVVDLQGVDLGNAEERQELEAQLENLGRKSYASRLGIKGDIEQIADLEKLAKLLTLNGKKSDALSVEARQPGNFVVLVPSSGGRLQSLEQASFKKAVKKLCSSGLRVLVEVVSLAEAKLCEKASVEAVIAKGHEADGLVGDQTSFVLVQEITAKTSLDVISYGGIGLHTVAAVYAAGAKGALISSPLLLARESLLPIELKHKLEQLDGTETALIKLSTMPALGYRVFAKTNHAQLDDGQTVERSGALPRSLSKFAQSTEPLNWIFPLGQDIAFASKLALRFKSVAGILDGVKASIADHIQAAKETQPLAPASPIARSHGTAFPIVQGAMTRVSDTAGFALSVARDGGLPFLALALMRKEEADQLLSQTKEKLNNLPWGVGMLGFVPNQLRQEQLEVIEKYKPTFAYIAGGRPDQAKFLEDRGIKTYLHVPSPMLLSSFIEMGSRRFIFEGKECGGHVGPRSSFVLWEAMIEKLLESIGPRDDASAYHVLFAGGIHDAKSAAMVAAMTAPLAVRGIKIGVLLGTAYLFTEEAVNEGAIVKKFQESALQCEETVLLETGPGHAIRCIESPYRLTFDEHRDALIAGKKTRDEVREELELMNLGRLRIASKGLGRVNQKVSKEQIISEATAQGNGSNGGAKLSEIPEEKQWADGMYMIGQVASMHDSVCTIKALHEDVAVNGASLIKDLAVEADVEIEAAQPQEPIAIVGMSCLFPKAKNVDTYWANILAKVDTIEEVPIEQWDWRNYYDKDPLARDKIYSKWGGFLEAIEFDPTKYGIPPSSLSSIDPMQILLLEVTDAALKDAGYDKRAFNRDKTSVVLANAGHGPITALYSLRSMLGWKLDDLDDATKKKIEEKLPEWTEDSFPGYLGNVTAGRVANRFDLGGVNFSIDAACGSSLAALHTSVAELRNGKSDVVLLSATDTHNQPGDYLSFSKTHAFSAQGRCSTFDAGADGIVISEGMAMLVLKRLKDAERDGDRIYAVIRGVGGSSDGRDLSLTAPRPAGQKLALRRAYADAGLSPSTVTLVEAHGTGTVAGDRAEVEALRHVFEEYGAAKRACAIGSVKTMIGHSKAAAGLASLIKVAKALYHKVLPPTINVTSPNPSCHFEESPFYINSETRPWIIGGQVDGKSENGGETPIRRAGVSAFGFGGTNFHAVLEEYVPDSGAVPQSVSGAAPSEMFVFFGRSRVELIKAVAHLADTVKRQVAQNAELANDPKHLARTAYAHYLKLAETRGAQNHIEGEVALAIVATSITDLEEKIGRAKSDLLDAAKLEIKDPKGIYFRDAQLTQNAKLAFMFPGQGSQYLNMGRDLAIESSLVRSTIESANSVLVGKLAKRLSDYIYPPPVFDKQSEETLLAELTDTRSAQPAVGAIDVALANLLGEFGVKPDMVAGHSYGEYVALYAAGVFDFKSLLSISAIRGRLLAESAGETTGAMAAVSAPASVLTEHLAELPGVSLANINGPTQTVIAGDVDSLEKAIETLKGLGLAAKRINVSQAFHSHFMERASEKLESELSQFTFNEPKLPVYSNTTTLPYEGGNEKVANILSLHTVSPVDFVGEVNQMYADGARVFVEVGPSSVLSNLVGSILSGKDVLTVSVDRSNRPGRLNLLHALAQLAGAGVRLDLRSLFDHDYYRELGADAVLQANAQPTAGKAPKLKYLVNSINIKRVDAPAAPAKVKTQALHPLAAASVATIPSPPNNQNNPKRILMSNNGAEHNGGVTTPNHQNNGSHNGPVKNPVPSAAIGAQQAKTPVNGASNNAAPSKAQPTPQAMPALLSANAFAQQSNVNSSAYAQRPATATAAANGRNVEQVMLQFQQSMLQMTTSFLETQQRVMLAYLQGPQGNQGIPQQYPQQGIIGNQQISWAPQALAQAGPNVLAAPPIPMPGSNGYGSQTLNYPRPSEFGPGNGLGNFKGPAPSNGKGHHYSEQTESPVAVVLEGLSNEFASGTHANGGNGKGTDYHNGNGSGAHGDQVSAEKLLESIGEVTQAKAEVAAEAEAIDADFLVDSLLDIVSQRTGYPVEMLDPALDLEADLGIDSIKRVEILNSFRRVLPESKREQLEAGIEDLAGTKTLQGIIDWLRSDPSEGALKVTVESAVVEKELHKEELHLTANPGPNGNGHGGTNGNGKVDLTVAKTVSQAVATASTLPQASDSSDLHKLAHMAMEALDQSSQKSYKGELKRSLVKVVDIPQTSVSSASKELKGGLTLIIADQRGIALSLAKKLSAEGLKPCLVEHDLAATAPVREKESLRANLTDAHSVKQALDLLHTEGALVSAMVDLSTLTKSSSTKNGAEHSVLCDLSAVPRLFNLVKHVSPDLSGFAGGAVIAVTSLDGSLGHAQATKAKSGSITDNVLLPVNGGIFGIIKTTKKELPNVNAKAIDFEPGFMTKSPEQIADLIANELFSHDNVVEVGYLSGKRVGLETYYHELESVNGSIQTLQKDSVVLVTGGARGITAEIILELASRYHSKFVVVGRSELPAEDEALNLRGVVGAREIKAAIIESFKSEGIKVSIPAVEAQYQKILREREIRHYVEQIKAVAGAFEYHSVDVRDEAAFAEAIANVYKTHGKIDVVIHGAGVIEDAYIKDKTLDSFKRVYETKVNGALTLAKHLKLDQVKQIVFFSSVVGRTGNAGQVDYVSANETVNKLALNLNQKMPNGRAFSVMWGPWKGGMAQPELESIFASYGWAMIDIQEGRKAFVEELKAGQKAEAEVLLVAEIVKEKSGITPAGPKLNKASVRRTSESECEFLFEVGAETDLFLNDHAFDGVPVMPMAFSLEYMAEAVKSLYPQFEILGVQNLDIPSGIVFDSATKTFCVMLKTVSETEEGAQVQAELWSGTTRRRINFKASFTLGLAFDASQPETPTGIDATFDPDQKAPYVGDLVESPEVSNIYGTWLFHGPLFQGIKSIDLLGSEGIVGSIVGSTPETILRSYDGSDWQIDPIMLDSAMQLAGVWARQFLDITVLPTGFKKMTRYMPLKKEPLFARILLGAATTPSELTCILAIYNREGKLAMLVEGLGGVGSKSLNRLSGGVGLGSKN